MEKELFLLEELENMLALAASNYYHHNYETPTLSFDTNYFDNYVSYELLDKFTQTIYERIKTMNSHSISHYLGVSVAQFRSETPEKREKNFITTYHNVFWYPNLIEFPADEYEVQYAKQVWEYYKKHFHLFKEAIEKALTNFKEGLIGNSSTISTQLNQETDENKKSSQKLKTNLSVPQLAYLFRLLNDLNPSIFEIEDKTDLTDFIANNFITKATKKDGISTKSVYNNFSTIDKDTANFWATKLKKMLEDARKI